MSIEFCTIPSLHLLQITKAAWLDEAKGHWQCQVEGHPSSISFITVLNERHSLRQPQYLLYGTTVRFIGETQKHKSSSQSKDLHYCTPTRWDDRNGGCTFQDSESRVQTAKIGYRWLYVTTFISRFICDRQDPTVNKSAKLLPRMRRF